MLESITNSKEIMPLYFYLQLLQTLGLHQDKSSFPRLIVGYRAPQFLLLTMRLLVKEMRLLLLILTYRLPHLGLWKETLLRRGLSSLTMTVSYHSLIHRFLLGRDSSPHEPGNQAIAITTVSTACVNSVASFPGPHTISL